MSDISRTSSQFLISQQEVGTVQYLGGCQNPERSQMCAMVRTHLFMVIFCT